MKQMSTVASLQSTQTLMPTGNAAVAGAGGGFVSVVGFAELESVEVGFAGAGADGAGVGGFASLFLLREKRRILTEGLRSR